MLIAYLALPVAFLAGPEAADNHSIQVLRALEARPGKEVRFDRNLYIRDEAGDRIRTFAGEELRAVGIRPKKSGTTSAIGQFVDKDTVELLEVRSHHPVWRDVSTIIGLLLVAIIWGRSLSNNP
jgi:hypothetical protein